MLSIRVGIIGCGSIAQFRHAPEYAGHEDVQLAAVYDRNPERSARMAEKYGSNIKESAEDLLQDPCIDAVSICTSNETHHDLSIAALRAGKHVLCEKPISVTIEEAEAMKEAALQANRILMIAHNQRFNESHQMARTLLRKGAIGRVLSIRVTFGHSGPENWAYVKSTKSWFFDKTRSVFGAAGDLGIHKFDLVRFLLDDDLSEIAALDGTLHKSDENGSPVAVNDNMVCVFRTRRGVLGTMALSWTYYGEEDNSTIIYGENGIMKILEDPLHPLIVVHADGSVERYQSAGMQTNDSQSDSGVIRKFVAAILQNESSPVDCNDGIASLRMLQAAAQSAREGRLIHI
ncbi:Gfo/Idh/MocA family protein [Paenibacillus sp. MMO-177]|uniref:Gfo/Idh/MocA family protein n=1 Tax=Paenibacillus sp. MMO-177 TaxID=3081289 RepID=UPI003016E557